MKVMSNALCWTLALSGCAPQPDSSGNDAMEVLGTPSQPQQPTVPSEVAVVDSGTPSASSQPAPQPPGEQVESPSGASSADAGLAVVQFRGVGYVMGESAGFRL